MTAVFESALPRGLKPLAAAMASYADDDGSSCHPSRARVAWNLDITTRQISRQLAQLTRRKILIQVARPAPGRATLYRFDASALPARPMFNARQRPLPIALPLLEAAELEGTGDIHAPRTGDIPAAAAASATVENLWKTPPSPFQRETSGAPNGGHLAPQDPPVLSGLRTTDAAAREPLRADENNPETEPRRLPAFAQLVQIAREQRTGDIGEWTENTRRRLIALGFGYDNDAIGKAQRAIEHVDRDGPPADASADAGEFDRLAALRELRARLLSATPRAASRLQFPRLARGTT